MPPAVTDVTIAWSVCIMSITLVHPAKAIGQNEMPFGRDALVVPSRCIRWGSGELGASQLHDQ